MKAVIYKENLAIDAPNALIDTELPKPEPGPRDLLVEVKAVSVNPVDCKVRQNFDPGSGATLGWDAVGVVAATGADVQNFSAGDRVWYAGAIDRPGTNSEFHVVDERIVAHAPQSLSDSDAAALPLTGITAWELLFERFRIQPGKQPSGDALFVAGGAGGVGSMLIQLAARLTSATVIAMAGREESRAWVKELGAHHVLNYKQPLAPQLAELGIPAVTHVASLTHTGSYFGQYVEMLAPFGQLALIDDPGELNVSAMKQRSLSLHWEFMFTRSLFQTPDMNAQSALLAEIAHLVDAGVLRTTALQNLGRINAENLTKAHALLESGAGRGKLVLEGF